MAQCELNTLLHLETGRKNVTRIFIVTYIHISSTIFSMQTLDPDFD